MSLQSQNYIYHNFTPEHYIDVSDYTKRIRTLIRWMNDSFPPPKSHLMKLPQEPSGNMWMEVPRIICLWLEANSLSNNTRLESSYKGNGCLLLIIHSSTATTIVSVCLSVMRVTSNSSINLCTSLHLREINYYHSLKRSNYKVYLYLQNCLNGRIHVLSNIEYLDTICFYKNITVADFNRIFITKRSAQTELFM